MEKNKRLDSLVKFLAAQAEAEQRQEHDFECPLCGGSAHWERAEFNNHLHTGCDDCHFLIME